MFLQKWGKKLDSRRPRPKEAGDWYMITLDRTGLHNFSIGTLNLQYDMPDGSIANEYCTSHTAESLFLLVRIIFSYSMASLLT